MKILDPSNVNFYCTRARLFGKMGDKPRASEDFNQIRRLRLVSLLHELNLPPADKQEKATVDAVKKRITEQVNGLKYDEQGADDLLTFSATTGI